MIFLPFGRITLSWVNLGLIVDITHRFEILHPLRILNLLLQFSQHGFGGANAFSYDNQGAINITPAQIKKLDRIMPNKRQGVPSGVARTRGIGANAKKAASFLRVRYKIADPVGLIQKITE